MHADIPAEIIAQILYYVPPEDNLRVIQCLSKRHHRLANEPLLWRYHCRHSFRYWDSKHGLPRKLLQPVQEVDWRRVWLRRRAQNERVSGLLDGILASTVGRYRKYEQICLLGYDAKDVLLENCRADDSAEDVLARRYHANAALDSIHRGIAVKEWAKYRLTSPAGLSLERALGCFDMFVLHDQQGDLDDIQASLDDYSRAFLEETPDFSELTTRQKALALNKWVRDQKLTGMIDPVTNYRNIRNCLIGHALLDEKDHSSLPLISSAIFCALAERVGLNSQCFPVPGHVHTVVLAPAVATLDGRPHIVGAVEPEAMYLDPFAFDYEVTEDLRRNMADFNLHMPNNPVQFHPVSATTSASLVASLVLRTAHNIHAAEDVLQGMNLVGQDLNRAGFRSGDSMENAALLQYAAHWVHIIFTPVRQQLWDRSLEALILRYRRAFAEDSWLCRKYLIPVCEAFLEGAISSTDLSPEFWYQRLTTVQASLHHADDLDARRPTPKPRSSRAIREGVHYCVGQPFFHRRYRYCGIITGWNQDVQPEDMHEIERAGEDMDDTEYMRVFYTCMKPGSDKGVVAQANVKIITRPDAVPDSMMRFAGKHFKRFDRESCTFVSNIKELYPDD